MRQVSVEELAKISAFVGSCNDMINGKFILADIKISKILKMIASSDELYSYISSCLVNFDFIKELHRAEVKNRFNGGEFVLPEDEVKVIAMVFSLLIAFNTKQLDFYTFIRENFSAITAGNEYNYFAKNVLTPFRNIIAKEFGISAEDVKSQINIAEDEQTEKKEKIEVVEPQVLEQKPDLWENLVSATDSLMQIVTTEKKIKTDLKDELMYLLKTIKHSVTYKDIQIVSALLSAFDSLTKKYRTVRFAYPEIEQCVVTLYQKQKHLQEQ